MFCPPFASVLKWSKPMSATQPRRYERVRIALEVRWQNKSGLHRGRTGDISLGGCFIESLAPVKVGEQILFEIELPSGRWQLLGGEAIYCIQTIGFGIRFGYLPELLQKVLAQVIEYERGD